jgi:hypothetical protein
MSTSLRCAFYVLVITALTECICCSKTFEGPLRRLEYAGETPYPTPYPSPQRVSPSSSYLPPDEFPMMTDFRQRSGCECYSSPAQNAQEVYSFELHEGVFQKRVRAPDDMRGSLQWLTAPAPQIDLELEPPPPPSWTSSLGDFFEWLSPPPRVVFQPMTSAPPLTGFYDFVVTPDAPDVLRYWHTAHRSSHPPLSNTFASSPSSSLFFLPS